jgi:hypothetical protein
VTVANGQEAVVAIPVVVPPIEVEVALPVVLVEMRHVAVAVDLGDRALCKSAIHATTRRVLSGLYRIRDLICRRALRTNCL